MVEDDDLASLYLPGMGTLYGSEEDCARLAADPSEETLSEILGYVESKAEAIAAAAPHEPLVVQARDGQDRVVHEMLTSSVRYAATTARAYGKVSIMTMSACLKRRQRLIDEEARDAKRFQGRPG
jgi:Asp/Glu/hydantoin racemase